MPIPLIRIVAWLIIPALLADPALASGVRPGVSASPAATRIFTRQAFASVATSPRIPFAKMARVLTFQSVPRPGALRTAERGSSNASVAAALVFVGALFSAFYGGFDLAHRWGASPRASLGMGLVAGAFVTLIFFVGVRILQPGAPPANRPVPAGPLPEASDRTNPTSSSRTGGEEHGRRTFLGVMGLNVLARLFQGRTDAGPVKPGVGDVRAQPIRFVSFDPKRLEGQTEPVHILNALQDYLIYLQSLEYGAWPLSPGTEEAFEQMRIDLATTCIAQSGFKVQLMDHLNTLGQPYADEYQIRINQILYAGLPAYLARFGLLLEIRFNRIDQAVSDDVLRQRQHPALERWTVYPVTSVTQVQETLWGQPERGDEIHVGPVWAYNGWPMASGEVTPLNAITIYQTLAMFESMIQTSTESERESVTLDPKRRSIVLSSLNVDLRKAAGLSTAFRDNPLAFSIIRLTARAMQRPPAGPRLLESVRHSVRLHEFQHLRDVRRGIRRPSAEAAVRWASYDETVTRTYVASELAAQVTAMRHVPLEDRERLIRQLILPFVENDRDRANRLVSFNFLDSALSILEAAWTSPEKRNWAPFAAELQVHGDLGLSSREQFAGQLDLLSESSWNRILDAIHAALEKNPTGVKMPADPSLSRLLRRSRPAPPARVPGKNLLKNKQGRDLVEYALLGLLVALGILVFQPDLLAPLTARILVLGTALGGDLSMKVTANLKQIAALSGPVSSGSATGGLVAALSALIFGMSMGQDESPSLEERRRAEQWRLALGLVKRYFSDEKNVRYLGGTAFPNRQDWETQANTHIPGYSCKREVASFADEIMKKIVRDESVEKESLRSRIALHKEKDLIPAGDTFEPYQIRYEISIGLRKALLDALKDLEKPGNHPGRPGPRLLSNTSGQDLAAYALIGVLILAASQFVYPEALMPAWTLLATIAMKMPQEQYHPETQEALEYLLWWSNRIAGLAAVLMLARALWKWMGRPSPPASSPDLLRSA